MRIFTICFLFVFLFLSCRKQQTSSNNINTATTSGSQITPIIDSAYITVIINRNSMQVTAIHYDRSTGSFNFTAQNKLQKVDVYCFHFYQSSGFNYQFSDSINYSVRQDTLSTWYTRRATNWGDVFFDCCQGPLTDKIITGNFSALFDNDESKLTLNGNFRLIFWFNFHSSLKIKRAVNFKIAALVGMTGFEPATPTSRT